MASRHLSFLGLRTAALAGLGLLGACGMPQASDPAPPPELAAEAPPVLLGGPEVPAPPPVVVQAEPARRPGWGAMAPIPNPPEYASAAPPYRLIGPTVADAPALARQSPPVRVAVKGRTIARRIVQAEAPAASNRTKHRVRHWIVPASGPSGGL